MPRNVAGTYTVPGGINPVVPGTVILDSWANPTLADVASGITDSLDRNGRGGMLAALRGIDGTVSAPAFSFTSRTDTGVWTSGAGALDFSAGGVRALQLGPIASAVNYLFVSGSVAGSRVPITAAGTDANIGVLYTAKGTGDHVFAAGGGTQLQITNTAGATRFWTFTGSNGGEATVTSGATLRSLVGWRVTGAAAQDISVTNVALAHDKVSWSDSTRGANDRYVEFNWIGGTHLWRFVNDAYSIAANIITATGGAAAGVAAVRIFGGANQEVLRVDNNLRVGIGGIAPAYKLDVQDNTANVVGRFLNSTAGSFTELAVSSNDRSLVFGQRSSTNASGELCYIYQANSVPIDIFTNGAARFRVAGAGNVTINAPSSGISLTASAIAAGTPFSASDGTVTAQLTFAGTTARIGATSAHATELMANGTVGLALTSDRRLYGSALHNNAGAVTGTTNQYIASGTYTPSTFASANIASLTAFACQWIRVGNVVHVSGLIGVDPTSASVATSFGLSLPIASTLASTNNLGGTANLDSSATAQITWGVTGDTANNRAFFRTLLGADATNYNHSFSFSYVVL